MKNHNFLIVTMIFLFSSLFVTAALFGEYNPGSLLKADLMPISVPSYLENCDPLDAAITNELQAEKCYYVKLEGNATTGYSWNFEISDDSIIEFINKFSEQVYNDGRVGSPSMYYFKFEALSEGETDIVFSYGRGWQRGVPPAETVTYKLSVSVE